MPQMPSKNTAFSKEAGYPSKEYHAAIPGAVMVMIPFPESLFFHF